MVVYLHTEASLEGDTHILIRCDREEDHFGTWNHCQEGSLSSDTLSGPLCWDLCILPVVYERQCVSYMVWGHLRAHYTYFMLFCNRVYQKIGPDVVNVGNQDG